ncbi:hypothetical protein C8J57DRAFT_1499908 [Mycena rebaudengoi]|nr:hypothetical protein C8J57DRAFT_1499908 [Mycena rebaudengoi]
MSRNGLAAATRNQDPFEPTMFPDFSPSDVGEVSDNKLPKKRRTPGACDNLRSAKGYVESLENRLEKMEKLLNKLLPGIDVTEQLDEDDIEPDLEPSQTSLPRNDGDHLGGALKKLTLNPDEHRFFGKSR